MVKRHRTFDGSGTSEGHAAKLHAAVFATVVTRNDCGFYGQWANPATRTIVAFTEGDLTRTECASDEEFTNEMRTIAAWHGPDDWRGIDPSRPELRSAFSRLGLDELLITASPAKDAASNNGHSRLQLGNQRTHEQGASTTRQPGMRHDCAAAAEAAQKHQGQSNTDQAPERPETGHATMNRASSAAAERATTTSQRITDEIAEAEHQAWTALTRYKFLLFGYWAGMWIHLNRIDGNRRANPWRQLVQQARAHQAGQSGQTQ